MALDLSILVQELANFDDPTCVICTQSLALDNTSGRYTVSAPFNPITQAVRIFLGADVLKTLSGAVSFGVGVDHPPGSLGGSIPAVVNRYSSDHLTKLPDIPARMARITNPGDIIYVQAGAGHSIAFSL